MAEDWLARWEQGRTGWHEPAGNAALKKFWPEMPAGSHVFVPLCGKSLDLVWLESRGLHITGIELSQRAVQAFFTENQLTYSVTHDNDFQVFRCRERKITIYCGDCFFFRGTTFDAVYDRGALVAIPADRRGEYARHIDGLLDPGAERLLITLEYDQSVVDGPPYSVGAAEVLHYWPDLTRVSACNDLESCPPKFREAGLEEVLEVTWITAG